MKVNNKKIIKSNTLVNTNSLFINKITSIMNFQFMIIICKKTTQYLKNQNKTH
jgi:hypothetical protein